MKTPIDLRYSKDHEWVKVEGEIAIIGITDFAQSELGDIVFVDVEVEGEVMEKDDVFGSIEAVKTISDLFLPVSGEVLAFNSELETKPEMLNSDPYEKGWIIKVKMDNKEELKSLLDAEAYKRMVEI